MPCLYHLPFTCPPNWCCLHPQVPESYSPKGVLELTSIDVSRLMTPEEGAALLGGGPPAQQLVHCQLYCYSHKMQKGTRQHFVAARQLLPGKA